MNKWLTKQFLNAKKINAVKGVFANTSSNLDNINEQIASGFGYPVIVKPNAGGSSIGIKVANNFEELKTALDVAFEFDDSAVIEKHLQNFTEYNCAVFGDGQNLSVSNIDEPIKKEKILSFADKYLSGDSSKKGSMKTQQRTYPKLPEWLDKKIKDTSKRIFTELGFWGVVRIDYIYQPKTKKLYVNEINAIPGSLSSYYFSNNKVTANMFIEKLVSIGINNYEKSNQINKNYITKLF